MQFLKTLIGVVIAAFLLYLGGRNWHDVTLNLWGDLQADIKVPVLVLLVFLLAFLPTYFIQRSRVWSLRRRLDHYERQQLAERERLTTGGPATTPGTESRAT